MTALVTASIVEVAAGELHTCARDREGRVWCWGAYFDAYDLQYPHPIIVAPEEVVALDASAIDIAASQYHTCALTEEGAVWCWGFDAVGGGTLEPTQVVGVPAGFSGVETGLRHTCAPDNDGTLWCWGNNEHGQLGVADSSGSTDPIPVAGFPDGVVQLALGSDHTCAIARDGGLWCWGKNDRGQLGIGSAETQWAPARVAALGTDVVSVAAAGDRTCAVTRDGELWCWGANHQSVFGAGRLGDGSHLDAATPVRVTALGADVTEVALGREHTCARKGGSSLWCWGGNRLGQLGYDLSVVPLPTEVASLGAEIAGVSVGEGHACGWDVDGGVWCWGGNLSGALGDGTRYASATPVELTGPVVPAVAVAAGQEHSCAIRADGTLWCWGYNGHRQVGVPMPNIVTSPVHVAALGSPVSGVATGSSHTCALQANGTLWCWGANAHSQAGADGGDIVPVPTQIAALGSTIAAVSAGSIHTCAIDVDGALWCWGSNDHGQLGTDIPGLPPRQVPGLSAAVLEVEAGATRTCARTADAKVWCWGGGDSTPREVAELSGDLTLVAASEHTCAVRTDGTLWCWGSNHWGQIGDGSTTDRLVPTMVTALGSEVTEVSAGTRGTCALKTDGSLWCWGSNQQGEVGQGVAGFFSVYPLEVGCPGG